MQAAHAGVGCKYNGHSRRAHIQLVASDLLNHEQRPAVAPVWIHGRKVVILRRTERCGNN
eukprot:6182851-Pleurochrysis_carterae.AAC.3